MTMLHRRTFVLGGLATAGTIALTGRGAQAAAPFPFKLGVASGEPDASSVVLWTRLAPTPLNADGQGGMAGADVAVDWQVSANDQFTSLVAAGTVTARYADAHSVHVVAGGLQPDAEYYYRFKAQGHLSAVGRTRTAPATGTFGRDLKMAFASCSHFEPGYYTAYRRMAEDRPDLILHLRDYIYEGGTGTSGVRQHAGAEIVSLADYRRRYAQYKSDSGSAGGARGRAVAGGAGRPRLRLRRRRPWPCTARTTPASSRPLCRSPSRAHRARRRRPAAPARPRRPSGRSPR
jgi:alkaline phosphatase D